MTRTENGAAHRRFWVGGATGFLGRHVVTTLRERGHEVSAVSRSGGQVGDVVVRSVDVLDQTAVRKSAEGCDGAFLCTGKVTRRRDASEELFQTHVVGTQRALDGLREAGVKRVVLASTSGTLAVSTRSDRIADE